MTRPLPLPLPHLALTSRSISTLVGFCWNHLITCILLFEFISQLGIVKRSLAQLKIIINPILSSPHYGTSRTSQRYCYLLSERNTKTYSTNRHVSALVFSASPLLMVCRITHLVSIVNGGRKLVSGCLGAGSVPHAQSGRLDVCIRICHGGQNGRVNSSSSQT